MHDLTAFQRDCLLAVADMDEPHGLEIKEYLEGTLEYGEDNVHHGRLYPNLDELNTKGFIRKGKKDRRTNFYTLAPRGEKELELRAEHIENAVEGED